MANTIRIRRRLAAQGAGAPILTGGNPLRNAELAFNEFSQTLYIGTGGDATGANAAGAVNAIAGDGAVWTGTATFGTVNATGSITAGDAVYAYSNAATSGKLLATSEYVDAAVARSTGSGMSLFPVAADCATTGPLNTGSYYDNLEGLGTVRIAVPSPVSAADAALLYELKGLPTVQGQTLAANDRVLIMGHTDASLIGLWRIPVGATASTYWTRETGYDVAQLFSYGARVAVTSGLYGGQNFAVASDPLYPTKDVAGPNFNSLNFVSSASAAPTGAAIKFKRVVRAKADFYTIVNGKVVVDGITLNQNDRFIWTPKNSAVGGGDGTGASYNNPRAGIYRVNYDRVVIDLTTNAPDPYAVVQRAGDLNESTDFVSANNTKVLVREGTNNTNKIFNIVSGATFTIDDSTGTVALFNYDSALTYTATNALTGTPVIDGYQTRVEDLAATPPVIGSVVLVKDEVNQISNGLYYVKTSGNWIRHPSANESNELLYGSYIRVNNGTINKNAGFVQVTNLDTITPGTHPLVFTSPSALLDFNAGVGLGRSGRSFFVKTANANRITVTDAGVNVVDGTTSAAGIVQLDSGTNSTSTTKAATPSAVKSAYDLADAALPKGGGTMAGKLTTVASTASLAAVNVAAGVEVTSNFTAGDIWNTGTALKFRDNASNTKTVAFTDSNITGTSGGLGYSSTSMAGTTTTLTAASTYLQYFTGSGTGGHTVVLPVNTTMTGTRQFEIHNNNTSTGQLTVNSSGGNLVVTVAAGVNVKLTCTNIASADATATPWVVEYNGATTNTGSGKLVYATSPDFTTSITTASTEIAVFNANATTVNAFGGASTALNMGNASGTTLIRGDLTLGASASGKKLRLNGATSGTVDIQAVATAGTTTATFPATTGNVVIDAAANTFTSTSGQVFRAAANQASITVKGGGAGTGNFTANLIPTTLTGDRTITIPDVTGTLVTTSSGSLASSDLRAILSDETGTGVAVFATSPTFTTSVKLPTGTPSQFDVFNEAVTTLNSFGNAANVNIASDTSFTSALAINIGNNLPASGQIRTINIGTAGTNTSTSNIVIGAPPSAGTSTTTLQGAVVVAGNLTVNGATTVLNTNTLSVDDKNIELGAGSSVTATCTVTPGSAVVTNLSSVAGIVAGGLFAVSSNFGTVTIPANTAVLSVDSPTQITLTAALTGSGGAQNNAVALIGGSTPSDATASGGGITLKAGLGGDKTIIWNGATNGWEFNQNVTTSGTTVNVNGNSPSIATSGTGTGAVFNAGVTTGNLFGACTSISIGASTGTCTINNATVTMTNATVLNINGASPAIVTSSTATASVFNTNATTVNVGGAASTATLGGASTTSLTLGTATAASTTNIATGSNPTGVVKAVNIGTTGALGSTTNVNIGSAVAGAITSVSVGGDHTSGGVTINPTTTSTTTATGALIVKGGVGVAENLNVGGNVTISQNKALNLSVNAAVSALGNSQGTATALTNDINIVTTAALSTVGVVLPVVTTGRVVTIINRGANSINVYPAVGQSIDTLGLNLSRTLAVGATLSLRGTATTNTWFSEITDLTNSATGVLPADKGGTAQSTYTLGDLLYSSAANTLAKLSGNTTTTRQVLTQLGTGSASAAPVWVDQCDIVANCTLDGGTF